MFRRSPALPSRRMPDSTFKRFGKYEIQAELGRGGFGRVFRAFDPTVGRLVAIKILSSEAGTVMLTRFRNEAMAAGNLRHENIVTIYEFGEENEAPFIAMEYLEGEDLQETIRSGRKLTLLEKIEIMTQAAAGLECAHRNGVVHRDVKPANIRLLRDGRVKILDFGIARLIRDDGAARLTHQGHVLGTLLYMAPEQVMGADTDALCDIFAYGVVFYELLTGQHPFRAEDPRSIFYKITTQEPELIDRLVPGCPKALDQVVRRALQKDRELRYQNLRDLRLDMEPVLMQLRRDRAATLVNEADQLLTSGDFEHSCSLLNEAIDLDPTNETARHMRESVQAELRKKTLRPRIDALVAKAGKSLAEEKYSEAVEILNSALRLAPDDETLRELFARVAARAAEEDREGRLQKEAAEKAIAIEQAPLSETIVATPPPLEHTVTAEHSRPPSYRNYAFIAAACVLLIAAVSAGTRILRPRVASSSLIVVTEPPRAAVQVPKPRDSARESHVPAVAVPPPAKAHKDTASRPVFRLNPKPSLPRRSETPLPNSPVLSVESVVKAPPPQAFQPPPVQLPQPARPGPDPAALERSRADDELAADSREISKVLAVYAAAFDRKDLSLLKSVWPGLPEAALAPVFHSKGVIRSELQPLAAAAVSGDRASVRCTRRTEQVTQFGRQKPVEQVLTVRLEKKAGRWIISAIN